MRIQLKAHIGGTQKVTSLQPYFSVPKLNEYQNHNSRIDLTTSSH